MMVATSIEIESELTERLRDLARRRHRSSASIMREALVQYVEREERRDAVAGDALRAWEDFRRDGLHITGREADAWLAKLEAGEDEEPPACHR